MTEAKRGNAPLLVLGKISAILGAFSLQEPERSLADIRAHTGMPPSTVQRLVANLVEAGFLDRRDDKYRVGVQLAYWSAPAAQGAELVEVVQPVLRELRDDLGETACFYRASRGMRVCVAMAETTHGLRRAMRVGDISPIHVGSAGRVIMAHDEELAASVLANPLPPITETTITDPAALRAALQTARADGYAVTTGERESAASGLSAPVFDEQARVTGAVTVMGPTLRMPPETLIAWVDPVVSAAERITRMLGGRRPAI